MDAVILTIGDEILKGRILDSNCRFIAARLYAAGFRVIETRCVGDNQDRIVEVLGQCFEDSSLVLATGGLGPTRDDVTKQAACCYFGLDSVLDENILRELRERFLRMGYSRLPESNRCQAEVPAGATVLPNPRGTAPGLVIEDRTRGRTLILMPGVPLEMRAMIEDEVLPLLGARYRTGLPQSRIVRTVGLGESLLAQRIEKALGSEEAGLLSYYPHCGAVDLLIAPVPGGSSVDESTLHRLADKVADQAASHTYARDERSLEKVIADILCERHLTLALAESCTGGLVAKRLTDLPGSSAYLDCGVVSYSNRAKTDFLGVPEQLIEEHGAVSEPVCRAMAEGLKKRTGADCTVSITGIAGPGGGSREKPVGTVYIGICSQADCAAKVEHFCFPGDREQMRLRSSTKALELLWRTLSLPEADDF